MEIRKILLYSFKVVRYISDLLSCNNDCNNDNNNNNNNNNNNPQGIDMST